MGHIVISDGKGGTIEAHSPRTGVIKSTLNGRNWHACVLVPGIEYRVGKDIVVVTKPDFIYKYKKPLMIDNKIKDIQKALKEKGFDPKGFDGKFGKDTQVAVIAFQSFSGIVIDGEVGHETLKALGLN